MGHCSLSKDVRKIKPNEIINLKLEFNVKNEDNIFHSLPNLYIKNRKAKTDERNINSSTPINLDSVENKVMNIANKKKEEKDGDDTKNDEEDKSNHKKFLKNLSNNGNICNYKELEENKENDKIILVDSAATNSYLVGSKSINIINNSNSNNIDNFKTKNNEKQPEIENDINGIINCELNEGN